MAHLNDGTLRRMVDDPNAITAPEREHFATCADCKSRLETMSTDAGSAAGMLALPAATFDAATAYRRVLAQPARPPFGFRLPILRPASRGMVAAIALTLAVAMVATASVNVFHVFAPTTVTPVAVSVADLQSLPDLATYGDLTWSQQPQPSIVTSKAAAEQIASFAAPTAGHLPAGVSTTVTYAAMSQATAIFKFSAAKAQAAAAAQGKTLPPMPAGMDGSTLTLNVGPVIVVIYGNLKGGSAGDLSQLSLPQLVIAESAAPSVSSTGVGVKQLEAYLLAQPGLSPQLAATIRSIGDPTTTLPIPVPIQYATSSAVRVQGVQGVALGDNTGLGAAVVWIKGGKVFFVGGALKQDEALSVANHLS